MVDWAGTAATSPPRPPAGAAGNDRLELNGQLSEGKTKVIVDYLRPRRARVSRVPFSGID